MSIKIPVGETISQSFGFAFRKYFTLLGIVWLPVIAMAAVVVLVLLPFFHGMLTFIQYQAQHAGAPDMANMPVPNFGLITLAQLLMLYIYAWMGAGATKEVLGLRTGSKFFYLPGKDEFNIAITYIAAFLLCYVAVIGVMIVLAIVCLIVALAVGGSDLDPAKLGILILPGVLLLLAIEIGFIYLLIRATWLIQPLTVVEKKIDVFGSWRLMKGNVLRACGIMIVMALPMIVLEIVVFGVAGAGFIGSLPPHPDMMKPQEVVVFVGALMERVLPFIGVFAILVWPLLLGWTRAPAAYAYRVLVPPPPPPAVA